MCDCFGSGIDFRADSRISRRVVVGSLAYLAIAPNASTARAQDPFKHLLAGACNFYDDAVNADVYSFGSSAEAQSVVQNITSAAGLRPNFEIISYNVPNAAAVIQNGIRYILYNPDFISHITQQTGSEWGSWAIMAHEVGHHLNGHTLQPGGSKPATELEADEFAGFAVQRIGGTLDQALSPYMTMNADGSSTHPPRDARLDAVTKGWNSAAGQGEPVNIPTPESVPAPVANARDMLTAIVTSIQSGMTPPFPMVPAVKSAYDAQVPMIAPQLVALGNLTGLTELKSPVVQTDATHYDYLSNFSTGQAY
jgi:hypothetical protein